jgi:nitrite reductase (NADH) small subunit
MTAMLTTTWVDVCPLDELVTDRGVCALVGPYQVAIFRVRPDGQLFAVSNYDPFSGAFVMSRGIVGSKGPIPKVTSPVYKHAFSLVTGECLDDPDVALLTFAVRAHDGVVQVGMP